MPWWSSTAPLSRNPENKCCSKSLRPKAWISQFLFRSHSSHQRGKQDDCSKRTEWEWDSCGGRSSGSSTRGKGSSDSRRANDRPSDTDAATGAATISTEQACDHRGGCLGGCPPAVRC